ncbi:hypothetical protein V8E36_002104 [Tilletia maclaganii]
MHVRALIPIAIMLLTWTATGEAMDQKLETNCVELAGSYCPNTAHDNLGSPTPPTTLRAGSNPTCAALQLSWAGISTSNAVMSTIAIGMRARTCMAAAEVKFATGLWVTERHREGRL